MGAGRAELELITVRRRTGHAQGAGGATSAFSMVTGWPSNSESGAAYSAREVGPASIPPPIAVLRCPLMIVEMPNPSEQLSLERPPMSATICVTR
jgi:hypothetical protein